MTEVMLPPKTRQEQKEAKGKALSVGISPWQHSTHRDDIIPKHDGKWNTYYAMYENHAIVRSAIDTVAKASTNVGFDFVPKDSRSRIKVRELNILKEFFDRQIDFTYELRRIYKDLLIYGDAFMYIVPDKARRPHSLKRLAPFTMAVQAKRNGQVEGYVQFDPEDKTNRDYVTYEPHEIIHFMIDDPNNDLYGLSPLASLERSVATDLYAQNFNAAYFANSGITGTIISVSGVNPDEIERNRKFLLENYSGPEAAHKPVFLEGQNVTVAKSVATHHEMGFLEGRKFSILEILAVLSVPPAKIGIMESANRSNSKEQDKSFRTESVMPLQYIVESAINGQFIKPILGVENTMFVHSEGDTRDAVELMNYYTKGIAFAIYNPNEVRAKMGMAPVDGGEINGMMTPTGFVPVDRMNLLFSIQAYNSDKVPEDPRDPASGEPMPKDTAHTEIASSVSRELAKSEIAEKWEAARQGIFTLLEEKELEDRDITKAYSYLHEAQGIHPQLDKMTTLLRNMQRTEDQFLRNGYFERVKDVFHAFLEEREEALENYNA